MESNKHKNLLQKQKEDIKNFYWLETQGQSALQGKIEYQEFTYNKLQHVRVYGFTFHQLEEWVYWNTQRISGRQVAITPPTFYRSEWLVTTFDYLVNADDEYTITDIKVVDKKEAFLVAYKFMVSDK